MSIFGFIPFFMCTQWVHQIKKSLCKLIFWETGCIWWFFTHFGKKLRVSPTSIILKRYKSKTVWFFYTLEQAFKFQTFCLFLFCCREETGILQIIYNGHVRAQFLKFSVYSLRTTLFFVKNKASEIPFKIQVYSQIYWIFWKGIGYPTIFSQFWRNAS